MLKTVDRPPLSSLVRDYVRQYIQNHNLSAGDPLPSEEQLADDIGVGRSSVREATKLLQSLGIVEIRQGFGLFVGRFTFEPIVEAFGYGTRIDRTTLSELGQVRCYLEHAAIADVVERITPDDVAELEALLAAWKDRATAGDEDQDIDEEFHYMLYRPLNNGAFLALSRAFWAAFRNLEDPIIHGPRPAWEDYRDHRNILDAVQAGDVESARRYVVQHFGHLQERILASYKTHPA